MRQITKEAAQAFRDGRYFSKSNTQVIVNNGFVELRLHGNRIAWRDSFGMKGGWTLCGWNTPTTRERLSGIGIYVKSKKFKPFWLQVNGEYYEEFPIKEDKEYTLYYY